MKNALIGAAIVLAIGGYLGWSLKNPASPSMASMMPSLAGNVPFFGKYRNGTYLGESFSSIYGSVQVEVVIEKGKIAAINVPVFPDDGGNNTAVSEMCLPILKQEAITVQSAEVNIVSGATETAVSFKESLASALAKAS